MSSVNIITVQNQNELDQCLKIRKEVFINEQHVDPSDEMDLYDIFCPSSRNMLCEHFLLLDEDVPMATSRMIEFDTDTVKFQRIAVLKSKRSLGYGKALLLFMEKTAKSQGYKNVVLDAQTNSRIFYEKSGYEAESENIFYDANIPHVRMRKTL